MARKAVVAGGTGLVGGHVLRLLLEGPAWSEIIALTRRDLGIAHPKLRVHEVDFDRTQSFEALVTGDDVFCCLGTTMKKAGNQEAFYAADFDIPYELARAASRNAVPQFLLVSSSGADPHSRFFYPRVKGELEQAVARLPFRALHIARPSLLLGSRSESRPLETLAQLLLPPLSPLMIGPLRPYRPIPAETVARALLHLALTPTQGVHLYPCDSLLTLAPSPVPGTKFLI